MLHVQHRHADADARPRRDPGTFAIESALEQLAYALKLDPVELRVLNHTAVNPANDKPWSSNHLKECYRLGAREVRLEGAQAGAAPMKDGKLLVGWGMATATYPGHRFPASAKARLTADGRGVSSSAPRTSWAPGAYTIFTQAAADALGCRSRRRRSSWGDSSLPPAPVPGGIESTASSGLASEARAALALDRAAGAGKSGRSSPRTG